MPQLTTAQLERLHAALLDAFNRSEFTELVQFDLEQDLAAIAGGATFTELVFNLLQWAQRHGRSHDLLLAARQRRPHNRTFQALTNELGPAPNATAPTSPASATQPTAAATPGGIAIGKIDAVNVGETQHIDQRGATFNVGERKKIDTGGGAYVQGNVDVQHGDFVGRDQVVHGDKIGGDKVGGDKITVGDVSGTGIAIGRSASASVQSGPSAGDLAQALAPLLAAIQNANTDTAAQAAAQQKLDELTQELAKGKTANDSRLAGILDDLAKLVPGAVAAIVSAFATPLLSGLAGPVTQFVLERFKRNQP